MYRPSRYRALHSSRGRLKIGRRMQSCPTNYNHSVNCTLICAMLTVSALSAQDDGFISLMPVRDVAEQWTAEVAPASIWSVRDGVISCKGVPNGFLRSKNSYR